MLSIGSTPKETHLDFERRSRREDRNYTWAKSYKFDTKSTVYGQFRAKIEILTQMIRATPIQKKLDPKPKYFILVQACEWGGWWELKKWHFTAKRGDFKRIHISKCIFRWSCTEHHAAFPTLRYDPLKEVLRNAKSTFRIFSSDAW